MNIKKLVSLLVAAAMLFALVPVFPASAAAEEDRETRLEKLIDFSERKHEMQKRSAPEVNRAKALDDPYANARIIVKSAKELDYTGSVDYVNGYNDWHIIQYASPEAAEKAAAEYSKLDCVEYAVPDAVMSIAQQPHVNSFLSWGFGENHVGAFNYNEWLLEDGVDVSSLPEIVVGIIDTGIDRTHPFFNGRIYSNGYDFSNGDNDSTDDHYHGTHVAGTVVDGTLPNVKVVGIKVMDSGGFGDTSDIVNGFEYANIIGCKVANASLRGPKTDSSYQMYSDVINTCTDAGTVYCVASGNDGGNAMNYVPGSVERAFTVAAHNSARQMAYFSNTGPCVDITAPGVNINSCQPGGGYQQLDGTSMATPHVAAACAMVYSFDPELDPDRVIDILKNAAADEGLTGGGTGLLSVTDLFRFDPVLNGENSFLHFTSTGAYPWNVDGNTAYSGNAGVNSSSSVLTAKASLNAYQLLSFEYKVSSQQNADYLRFKVDGQTVFETSGETGWQSFTYTVPTTGTRTLTWEFSKDASGASGSDKAYLRNIMLADTVNSIINAGSDPVMFTNSSAHPWVIDYDENAARSGNSGVNSSVSELTATKHLDAGISIMFQYRTECGAGDKLQFLVDGSVALEVTASENWTAFEYQAAESRDYTFSFRFVKDGAGAVGRDCAWIREVRVMRSLSSSLNVPGGHLVFTSDGLYPWIPEVGQAKSGNRGVDSSESALTMTVSLRAGDELSFRAKVSSENNYDKYYFDVNGSNVFIRSGNIDWFTQTYTAQTDGVYTFVWRYVKDYSVSSGSDEAYLADVRLTRVQNDPVPGDSNENGSVEAADALLAMRYALGLIGENGLNLENADMDANGNVTMSDAVVILRMALGLV